MGIWASVFGDALFDLAGSSSSSSMKSSSSFVRLLVLALALPFPFEVVGVFFGFSSSSSSLLLFSTFLRFLAALLPPDLAGVGFFAFALGASVILTSPSSSLLSSMTTAAFLEEPAAGILVFEDEPLEVLKCFELLAPPVDSAGFAAPFVSMTIRGPPSAWMSGSSGVFFFLPLCLGDLGGGGF